MAVLETIRVKFGVLITVLIAIALLSFIVDPSVFNSCTRGNGDVAEIEGNKISYMDYQSEVEKTRIAFDSDPRMRGQINNAGLQAFVWSKFLDQYGFFEKYNDAGVSVSDYELASVLQTIPDYNYLVSVKAQRPDAGLIIDNLAYQIKNRMYLNKYVSLFQNAAFANPLAIAAEMEENSDETQFVSVPLSGIDAGIEVSAEEVEAWYNAHKEEFKLPSNLKNQREIEFAVFDIVPAASDIAEARERVEDQLAEISARPADEFSETKYYMSNELVSESSKLNDFVFEKNGKDAGIVDAGDSLYAVRVLDSKMLPDSIEFMAVPAVGDNTSDSLFNSVQPISMSFNELDNVFADPFEIVNGAKNKAFVAAAKDQNKFLVKILDKKASSLHKRVSFVKEVAFVSEETDGQIYDKASEFSGKVGNYETFVEELAAVGQKDDFHRAVITSEMYDIPYVFNMQAVNIRNARELVKWAFNAEAGNVSEILKLDNLYVVAALKEVNNTGYMSLEQSKTGIEARIRMEKQLAALAEDVKAKIAGLDSMESIAEKLDSKVSTEKIIFSHAMQDPKFTGAVAASETGKIYGPIVGMNAVYVYKVVSREKRNPIPEEDIRNRKFSREYPNYLMGNVYESMYGSFDIKDDRVNFM